MIPARDSNSSQQPPSAPNCLRKHRQSTSAHGRPVVIPEEVSEVLPQTVALRVLQNVQVPHSSFAQGPLRRHQLAPRAAFVLQIQFSHVFAMLSVQQCARLGLVLLCSSRAVRVSEDVSLQALDVLGREIAQQVMVAADKVDYTFASFLHGDKASDPARVPRPFLEYLSHNMGLCGEVKIPALQYGVASLSYRGFASFQFSWSGAMNEMKDKSGRAVRSPKSVKLVLGGAVNLNIPWLGHLRFIADGSLSIDSPNVPGFVDLIAAGFGALLMKGLSNLGSLTLGMPSQGEREKKEMQELEMALQANYGESQFLSKEYLWAEFALENSELIYLQMWSCSMLLTWERPSHHKAPEEVVSLHLFQLANAISRSFFNGNEMFITESCTKEAGVRFNAEGLSFEQCPYGFLKNDLFFCYPPLRNGKRLKMDERGNVRDSLGRIIIRYPSGKFHTTEEFVSDGLPAQRMCRVFHALAEVDPNYAKVKNVEVTITGNYEDTLTEKWNKFFNVKSTRTFKIPPHVYAVVPRIFDRLLGALADGKAAEVLEYIDSFDEERVRQEAGTWLKIFWDDLGNSSKDGRPPVPINEEIDEQYQATTWAEVEDACQLTVGDQGMPARAYVSELRRGKGDTSREEVSMADMAKLLALEAATIKCATATVVSPLLRLNIGGTMRALLDEVRASKEDHRLSGVRINTKWTGTLALQADNAKATTFVSCVVHPSDFLKVSGAWSYAFKGIVNSDGRVVNSNEATTSSSFSFKGYVTMPTVTFLKGIGYTYSGCANRYFCPKHTGDSTHEFGFNLQVPEQPWMKGDKLSSAALGLSFEALAQDLEVHVRNFQRAFHFEENTQCLAKEQASTNETVDQSVKEQEAQKSFLRKAVERVQAFFTEIPSMTTAHLIAPIQTGIAVLNPTNLVLTVRATDSYKHGQKDGPKAIAFGIDTAHVYGTDKIPSWLQEWSVVGAHAYFTSGVSIDLTGILIDGLRTAEGRRLSADTAER
ncbi:hypothetical protein AK812_SmicGene19043 [Symbiodinium microadriaticum]|uniref:Uncharacterized protein n=1 Tax=Symbiodinium microadriaticum TaxID=2951 RepID=A0A1Q9DTI9_SYMMI|nr:hypothetical protein AK812_SmicGene19043 [Symbiodinium microadriaticum]